LAPEAPLESTGTGLNRTGDGWFVLNGREGRWYHAEGRGARTDFEGDVEFEQVGVHLFVLEPGEPMGMYHWEADQEDFLVVSGEALLIVEGEERPLRQWDFVHCPPGTRHMIVGAGSGPCVIAAAGSRQHTQEPCNGGGYVVDEAALRHDAGVSEATSDPGQAYARYPDSTPAAYEDGWLAE
jgi:uncharacterized cupin superfamily protein